MHRYDARAAHNWSNCETLESRTLLAGATLSAKGTLEIIGSVKVDTIFVTYGTDALDTVVVQVNRDVSVFQFDEVERITVQSGGNPDRVEFRALALNRDRWKIPTTIYGSNGDDLIIAGAGPNRIYGGAGNDTVLAGFTRDIIYGELGNDSLDGGRGNDYIRGGDGNDTLTGGRGSDNLFGENGNDTLFASGDLQTDEDIRPFPFQTTFDVVEGGPGIDRASADANDRLVSIESTFTAT